MTVTPDQRNAGMRRLAVGFALTRAVDIGMSLQHLHELVSDLKDAQDVDYLVQIAKRMKKGAKILKAECNGLRLWLDGVAEEEKAKKGDGHD